jgi:serine/threonine protein kinase/Tfp pilus assembly protein PilF
MSTDRNLLFGILALQMDFVSRDGLIQGMNAWVLEKSKPLGQILQEQGALHPDAYALLEPLVAKHLEMHGDAEKSLAAVSWTGLVREELKQIANAELRASLANLSPGRAEVDDSWATKANTVGMPTSSGLRFRILRPHAKGGLGQVSVAHDEELQREVALKEIQDCFADDAPSRARFLLEAQITGGLEHPGIVPVYGLGTYPDGRPYYAMRFIKGDSLKEAIARFHQAEGPGRDAGERSLSFRQLLGRFVSVCNAVAYAHSRGVLHRDLKPGNVMLGPYGETLVVDWGLAKPVGRQGEPGASTTGVQEPTLRPASAGEVAPTQLGTALGTPAYMPPEQAAGRLDLLGPGSDVYSLGATLYCLLTGEAPLQGNDKGGIMRKVRQGNFPPPRQVKRGLPAALEAICLKAMALKPEGRYSSVRELADEIEHWLADEPVQAYAEPWRIRSGRWIRRHRTVVTALAATLLAVLVIGGAAWFLVTEEQTARLEQKAKLERAQREKAEQRVERTRLAEEELRRAVERRNEARRAPVDERAKWNDAFAAVKRAEGLLAGGEADATVRGQVQKLLREMEAEARDSRLLARLDDARLQAGAVDKETHFDYAGAAAQYAQAFRRDGLDIMRTTPREAARRLKRRSIKAQLVSFLDDWVNVSPDMNVRLRLWAILEHVDSDPASFRRRCRKARGNRKELVKLISRQELRALSSSDLGWLGNSLRRARAVQEAVQLLRQGWASYPGDFWINFELAHALQNLEKPPLGEAIRFYTAALAIRPQSFVVYNNLAVALYNQQDLRGAIAAYRKAIAINPKFAKAWNDLGAAMYDQHDLQGAIAAYRKAIGINPKDAYAYNNLGNALADQKDLKGAIAAYRKAIDINPRDAAAYYNLGRALYDQKDWKRAIAAYGKAIDINPKFAAAYNNLANVLTAQQDLKGAIAAYRKAIDINPRDAVAYNNLGRALYAQKDQKEAIAAYRKAIDINPRYAAAHLTLGLALRDKGEFSQALVSLEAAARWWPTSDRRRPALVQFVGFIQRLADLESTLPAILDGKKQPQNNSQRLEYAQICQPKELYAAAARFYEQAFVGDSKLAEDLKTPNRYNAACAAARAGRGQGKDAAKLDDQARTHWRNRALAWLRADLALWAKELAKNTPLARRAVRDQLHHWQKDPDLAGIRDAEALAKLPPAEQTDFKKLWADVAALLQKAGPR